MNRLKKHVRDVFSGKEETLEIWVALSGAGLLVGKIMTPSDADPAFGSEENSFWLEEAYVIMANTRYQVFVAEVSYAHIAAWGFAKMLKKLDG